MLKLAVISDVHYYSETLGNSGRAYEIRSKTDQKCLAESGAILDAALAEIAASDCDALLVAGDMSNDGEIVSHNEFREKLTAFQEKKDAYVIYATHDWCSDGNARAYKGDEVLHGVPTQTPPGLREFYRDFGANRAYDEYVTHLNASSYAVKLPGVRLIALNDDQNGKGASGYSDEHLEWILRQVRDAKANGEAALVMEHHMVLPNVSPLVNGHGQCIGERERMAKELASAGVDVLIVGHSHFQRTTEYTAKNGNVMTQINVASLSGYPAPIAWLTFDGNECRVDVTHVESFEYRGKTLGQEYLRDHSEGVIRNVVKACAGADTEYFVRIMREYGVDADKARKLHPVLRTAAKKLLTVKVGTAAKAVNALTLRQGIDKHTYRRIYNDNLFNHICDIFLCLFDGRRYDVTDPVFLVALDVANVPSKALAKLLLPADARAGAEKTIALIQSSLREIMHSSGPDNLHHVIKL